MRNNSMSPSVDVNPDTKIESGLGRADPSKVKGKRRKSSGEGRVFGAETMAVLAEHVASHHRGDSTSGEEGRPGRLGHRAQLDPKASTETARPGDTPAAAPASGAHPLHVVS